MSEAFRDDCLSLDRLSWELKSRGGQKEFFASDAGFCVTFPTLPERSTQKIDL